MFLDLKWIIMNNIINVEDLSTFALEYDGLQHL